MRTQQGWHVSVISQVIIREKPHKPAMRLPTKKLLSGIGSWEYLPFLKKADAYIMRYKYNVYFNQCNKKKFFIFLA